MGYTDLYWIIMQLILIKSIVKRKLTHGTIRIVFTVEDDEVQ